MATAIEWADETLNTGQGCTRVSAGCKHCYMFRILARQNKPSSPHPIHEHFIEKRIARLGKTPKRVFLNSMTDTFHESYSTHTIMGWFDMLLKAPHHYLVLTKRSRRMARFLHDYPAYAHRLWFGVSVEDPRQYGRLADLRNSAALNKFVSIEPLISSVRDIDLSGMDWVILGGESDLESPRTMNPEWALEVRDACRRLGIPFFFKQMGGSHYEAGHWGGNRLEGRTYQEFPESLQAHPPPRGQAVL